MFSCTTGKNGRRVHNCRVDIQTWSKVTLTEEFNGVFNLTSFLPQYLMTATAIVNEVIDGISWRTDFVIYGMGDTMEIIDFHDGNVLLVGAVKVSQF